MNTTLDRVSIRRVPTQREAAEKHRAFLEACVPVNAAFARILGYYIPKIIVHHDGRIEHEWPDEAKKAMEMHKEVIDQIARLFQPTLNRA